MGVQCCLLCACYTLNLNVIALFVPRFSLISSSVRFLVPKPKRYCCVWLLRCQLASVLSNYCKLYDQFVESKQKHVEDLSKEDLDQEAKKAAQDALEKLEIPDLRLGRAILENCKSCAEQGNVREEMRKEENFFGNMFRMIKHEDEIVSGMACQALANAAFDVEGRPMLLEMNAIPEFVKCLTYKDVDTQVSLRTLRFLRHEFLLSAVYSCISSFFALLSRFVLFLIMLLCDMALVFLRVSERQNHSTIGLRVAINSLITSSLSLILY
mmetsp:Transcript_12614/g.44062  ORF Transcript_12614/g.44062 Transcript_12614/m.44062 type:complete len:268 (-) Transcript_12614:300-1103(-)